MRTEVRSVAPPRAPDRAGTRPRRPAAGHVCRRRPAPQPGWSGLLLAGLIMVVGLALIELAAPTGLVRHGLRAVAMAFTVVAIRCWIHANRVALAFEGEAACCTATVTVRVIRARGDQAGAGNGVEHRPARAG